jgi:hypothetical protein
LRSSRYRREAELYPVLKQHFQRQGYTVYAEVPAPHGGYVDLLAVKGQRSVAVELKLRFSRLALRQAGRNRRFVWQSYVAVSPPVERSRRFRSLFTRRGVGLLLAAEGVVDAMIPAKEMPPPFTVREVFGSHLQGELAAMYAGAIGGVPARERVSAWRTLAARVERAIRLLGGTAATEQILEDTLGWNYFRAKRAGLHALLETRFHQVAPGLWALPGRERPALHAVDFAAVIRTQDPALKVIVAESDPRAAPGDVVWFVDGAAVRARALLRFAACYAVKGTPQRELRAGPAVFSPWRVRGPLPQQVIVAGLAGYRELRHPKPVKSPPGPGWRTLRPRLSSSAQT